MTFAEKLRAIRTEKGLSQKALATETGISQQAIAGYELGANIPNWTAVQSIARALGVTCTELTDDPEPPEPTRKGKKK